MVPVSKTLFISLKISLLATLAAFLVGLPLAWALSRPKWRGKSLLDVLVNLPLALPPAVLGYYLLVLLSKGGPVGKLTQRLWGGTLIFTQAGAVVASGVVCLPLFVQAARNALEAVPQEVYEAAQVDGASRPMTFRYISLPLSWSGIWTGVLLAWARSLGEFGATLMVAGNLPGRTQTLSIAVYSAAQAGNRPTANLLAGILTAVAGLSMWYGLRFRGKGAV